MSTWSSPVRYAECDQQGVAFNGHYLTWADEAATALMAELGTPYAELLARGLDTSVVASELAWSAPARWGDVVDVDGEVAKLGRTSFVFALTIRVGERACCVVRTTYVLVDRDRTPVALPEDLREAWAVRPA
ncbi:MAG: thioesterase superfamily protein [Frankiales bacterium]|nr:thioesterase superfamily protein [Frankiales bacterium]